MVQLHQNPPHPCHQALTEPVCIWWHGQIAGTVYSWQSGMQQPYRYQSSPLRLRQTDSPCIHSGQRWAWQWPRAVADLVTNSITGSLSSYGHSQGVHCTLLTVMDLQSGNSTNPYVMYRKSLRDIPRDIRLFHIIYRESLWYIAAAARSRGWPACTHLPTFFNIPPTVSVYISICPIQFLNWRLPIFF